MGFAQITDQLACDDCLDYKEAYRTAKEFCKSQKQVSWILKVHMEIWSCECVRMCKANMQPFVHINPTSRV